MNPALFHLAGVILHTMSTVLLFTILRRLLRNDMAAAVGALLFGIHPLQVEAVVFAGALNNPLAGFFSLLAIWQYLSVADPSNRLPDRSRWIRSIAGLLSLLMALLSKPSAVVVPTVAFALDLAFFQRSWRSTLHSITPWALLVLPCVVWTKSFQHGTATSGTPIWFRPLIAGDAIAFYLWKIFVPVGLAIDYGRNPQFEFSHGIGWLALLAPGVLIALAVLCRRRSPAICAVIVIFIVCLLPNLGLLPFDYQVVSTVADRYAYFSMIAVAVTAAITMRFYPNARLAALLLLVFLAVRTEMQITTWKNGETLFRHALQVNPDSWMSDINLASVIADRSPDEAIHLCERGIALQPNRGDPWNTIGTIRLARGDRSGAISAFSKAHELAPSDPTFGSNLARARKPARESEPP